MFEQEVWKDVVGYEGIYQISNHGRLKSLARDSTYFNPYAGREVTRRYKERMMKTKISRTGYIVAHLRGGADVESGPSVHRLVAEAFIPNPENKPTVNHKDGNKKNNFLNNLEWHTISENTKHAYDIGLLVPPKLPIHKGQDHPQSKLKNTDIPAIIAKRKSGMTYAAIAKEYGTHLTCIFKVCNRETYTEVEV